MAYVDYGYYTTTYLGTAIMASDFPRLSLRASSFLDYYTQGRAAQNKDLDAVKMACCAVAEQYQAIDTAQALAQKSLSAALSQDGGELKSQTVGSWSKTYQSGGGRLRHLRKSWPGGSGEYVPGRDRPALPGKGVRLCSPIL